MLGGTLVTTELIYSHPIPDGIAATFSSLCLAGSDLLLVIGLAGFGAYYRDRLGRTGRVLLLASALGSSISLIGDLSLAITAMDWLWALRQTGILLLLLSMILFGLACLIRRPLPRYNGIPFLIGISIPAGIYFGLLYHDAVGTQFDSGSPVTFTILATMCLGFILLGNMLRTDPGDFNLESKLSE
jgi:hypothetical protein